MTRTTRRLSALVAASAVMALTACASGQVSPAEERAQAALVAATGPVQVLHASGEGHAVAAGVLKGHGLTLDPDVEYAIFAKKDGEYLAFAQTEGSSVWFTSSHSPGITQTDLPSLPADAPENTYGSNPDFSSDDLLP